MINQPSVLVVSQKPSLGDELSELLSSNLDCTVEVATDFGSAIDAVIKRSYTLVMTEIELDALSGIDLLAAIDALHVHTSVMLVDKEMTGKSALAAMRLGAVDYLFQPLNPEFVLQRVQEEFSHHNKPVDHPIAAEKAEAIQHQREAWMNPVTRPAAFILRRPQFVQIDTILRVLQRQTGASFAGLRDSANNIVSAAGELARTDLKMLSKVLAEANSNRNLAAALQEDGFTNTYLGGTNNSLFITDFGNGHPVSLVVICPIEAKQGAVWLSVKRAALEINAILDKAELAQRRNVLELTNA